MARLLCPYCFEQFRRAEIAFRCINPRPNRCPPEDDEALGNYQGFVAAPKLPRVFTPPAGWWGSPQSAVCNCGVKTTKRICPRCHNDLPGQFDSQDSYNIALIGAKDSGKSHYIAVLIHELRTRVGQSFNASLSALDEQTIKRYNEDFRRYIYDEGVVIPGTLSARAQIKVRYPLVYRFSLERKGLLSRILRLSSLVFFDTAGEDLNDMDVLSTEAKYLANSHGLIFLLDPLQIPSVRHTLSGSVPLPSENTEPMEIITRVTDLIRRTREITGHEKIKTPVALAFSKIDAVWPIIDDTSPVRRAPRHDGFFDTADAEDVNQNMRAYVEAWIGTDEIDRFMRHHYETYFYFGLSSLGSPPEDGRLPRGITPFRVEDPLLWILHRLRIIPGQRSQQ